MSRASPASVRSRNRPSTAAMPPPQMTTRKRSTRPSRPSVGNHGVKRARSPDGKSSWHPGPVAMTRGPTKVTIVGGGVAALETLIALRRLAEDRVALELITPTADWAYRPLAVAEPFGLGEAKTYDLVQIARDHGAALHLAGVQSVDTDARGLSTWDGRELAYEILVMAVGAQSNVAVPGAVTVKGPGYTSRFRTILRQLDERRIHSVAFAVPGGASWPLPL